jgi:hypothetical protein
MRQLKSSLLIVFMYCHTQPLNPIIPIIFKSKENLDNNYIKTIKNDPFIGYEDMSGVFNCGSLFETQERDPFTILHSSLSAKTPAYNTCVMYRI